MTVQAQFARFANLKKLLTREVMKYAKLSSDMVTRPRDGDWKSHPNQRRALVLTDEEANHHFRASLPPHVKEDLIPIPADALWRLTKDDVRGAASTYVAATAAILAFII